MPELPDLEVFCVNLNKKLHQRRLLAINFAKGAVTIVPEAKIKRALKNQVLNEVFRDGKELRFSFGKRHILGLHLMLHGKMEWFEKGDKVKYVLAGFFFEKGLNLAITDFQRKANFKLDPPASEIPDAMDLATENKFWEKLTQSRKSIKSLLMDQHVVRGIGNAYADEILWVARISPFSIANKIPEDKIKALNKAIKKVLKHAISFIKKSAPGIIGGEERAFLSIHTAKKKRSPGGALIQTKIIGGRKTYFTREQKLYK